MACSSVPQQDKNENRDVLARGSAAGLLRSISQHTLPAKLPIIVIGGRERPKLRRFSGPFLPAAPPGPLLLLQAAAAAQRAVGRKKRPAQEQCLARRLLARGSASDATVGLGPSVAHLLPPSFSRGLLVTAYADLDSTRCMYSTPMPMCEQRDCDTPSRADATLVRPEKLENLTVEFQGVPCRLSRSGHSWRFDWGCYC